MRRVLHLQPAYSLAFNLTHSSIHPQPLLVHWEYL